MDGYPCERDGWRPAPAGFGDDEAPLPQDVPIRLPGVTGQSSAAAPVNWIGIDSETHGAWFQTADGSRFRLLVETLPDGGWDWIIWHTGDRARSGSGKALTAICAKLAAEHALMRIAGENR